MSAETTRERAARFLVDAPESSFAVLAPPWTWDDGEPHFELAHARLWVWNDPHRALVRKTTLTLAEGRAATSARDVYLPVDRLVGMTEH